MSEDAIEKTINESEKERLRNDSLLNFSIRNLTDEPSEMAHGYIKLSFSDTDGYCFCSKWKRFKTWFKNLFRRNNHFCCSGGLRSYYDATNLAHSGLPIESNWFKDGD